ncbi:tyrosine-type recombinase/integrase [Enterococcus faecalis]|uniref:Site-specific recombinase, phage integrase family n=1 Tax=Enterococcus faecalis RP2S-4 TaxID=1244145 RepID=A0ABC9TIE8_ENTFL|nr:tyrosine-type recombinase/integrase [Enterococcus faecalis]EPI07677.1 site-specific recombinase, phage integrase family [Enterococcus faecalis RP2S-4]
MASIKQQNNGKWRYRVRYKENGKFREISKSGFRTKRDAQSAAIEIENKIGAGSSLYVKDILVHEYLDTWLKIKERQVKKSTLAKIKRAIRIHILPKFAYYKVTEIQRIDCINWVNEMCNYLSVDSAKSYCATFSTALEDAVNDYKLIESNPMKNIKYPRNQNQKKDIQFFEKNDLKKLLAISETYKGTKPFINYQYYVLTYILSRTGLRLGEALALKWEDLKENTLAINKTLYRENHTNFITEPKTDSSYRTILLDNKSLDLLKKFKIQKLEYSLKSDFFILNKEYIFTDSKGDFLKQCNYRTYFSTICKLSDVPKLSPHALRHSHAVHLLESGSNIKFVSERLGHSTINMTANVYLHVSKKMETDSISRYEKFF